MTDDAERNDDKDDGPNEPTEVNVGLGGLLGSIGDLIEALSNIEETGDGSRSRTGRFDRSSFTIDYDYNVDVGLGSDDDRRGRSSDEQTGSNRTVDVNDQDSDDYTVDVREYDDEIIVSADLPGITESELDVASEDDPGVLTINVDGEVIERITVDAQFEVADVSFKNQILQIRLQPREDSHEE